MILAEGTFTGLAGPECELFQRVLKDCAGVGVEIGCLDGFSSAIILESSKLALYSIDPFIPDSMAPNLIGSRARFMENVQPFGDRAKLSADYSYNVVKGWRTPLDFLFIDGDHNYQAVLQDFNQWTPHLKVGGMLAIHDSRMYRPQGANFHPGPSQVALQEIYQKPERWTVIGEAFSLTVAVKSV
jgi:hypothetical protein